MTQDSRKFRRGFILHLNCRCARKAGTDEETGSFAPRINGHCVSSDSEEMTSLRNHHAGDSLALILGAGGSMVGVGDNNDDIFQNLFYITLY